MSYELVRSPYGYLSVTPIPDREWLSKYYRDKYYQESAKGYERSYSEAEVSYFLNDARGAEWALMSRTGVSGGALLDVGAGEGFFSRHFFDQGWDVTCLDYSDSGMSVHNPELRPHLIKGDVFASLETLASGQRCFELINLRNVLEHVIDPIALLRYIKPLLSEGGVMRIVVPNDYSEFQAMLKREGLTSETWFAPPDHLHYFTLKSLQALVEDLGYELCLALAEFPIELFITNEHSNYAVDGSKGRAAHLSRVMVTNHLVDQDLDGYIEYCSAAAAIGFGRQIAVYLRRRGAICAA